MISGTRVELGISPEALRAHHLAILGMSGMGKSTVSRRVCEMMAEDSFVVAMDGTGEYRTRFNFDSLPTDSDASEVGMWVYEPGGQPAQRAHEFIEKLMTAANEEYSANEQPLPRTLLLEEAHSYLPEWNFNASRQESEWVSKSARYILQARKFGLSFVMVSQRTAVISKVRTQPMRELHDLPHTRRDQPRLRRVDSRP